MEMSKRKLNYIDLFAGCGGLSLGLHSSGCWQGIFAIEKSADAFTTLQHNLIHRRRHFDWPHWLDISNYNINQVLKEKHHELSELKDSVELVAGGPPCQGFSTAGRRAENDARNLLVHSYLDFIEIVRPKMIMFENVRGFQIGFRQHKGRGQPYSEMVLDRLKQLGYTDAQAKVINFSQYGVPQHRERCIIIGTQFDEASSIFRNMDSKRNEFLKRKRLSKSQSVSSAISDIRRQHGVVISPDNSRFTAGIYESRPRSSYQKLMRKEKCQFPDSHRFANHSESVEEKFEAIITEKLRKQEINKRFNTKKNCTQLLEPDKPAPTLTTLPDDYVHYCEPRILTVREYARIQSFPDWYEFKGKYTTGGDRRKDEVPRYSQIGNAIPPLFAEHVGLILHDILIHAEEPTI